MGSSVQRVGVFHLGLQHAWQTALAFQEGGQLGWFATTIFHDENAWPYRIERHLPPSLRAKVAPELRRRASPLINSTNLRLFGLTEWSEILLRRTGLVKPGGRQMLNLSRRYFSSQIIRLVQREPVDVLWGYNGFARDVFRWAKARGIRCVLDQTIGHYRAQNEMLERESAAFPDFFADKVASYSEEFIRHQEEELELADLVVAGSTFVKDTLVQQGVDPGKVIVTPYGFEETEFGAPNVRTAQPGRPLEFLFLGQIHPRKGVHYLLDAFAGIPAEKAKLTLVGSLQIPAETMARYTDRVQVVRHVPRQQVPSVMKASDCFIFPSLFEGSALVLYEALGSGMGRIYTPMAGHDAPKGDGLCLQDVSSADIREAVLSACAQPAMIEAWSRRAIARREGFTWSTYRQRIRELIASH